MKGNTYEPPVRIELTTCALQVRCSTTELERPALQVSSNTAAAIMAVKSQN